MIRAKKLVIVFACVSVVLGAAMMARAGNIINAQENYTLEKEEIIDDNVYLGAGNVNILGSVNGDLLVGGGNIFISGVVEKDIMAAGGTINFQGSSLDDMRVAGGNLNIGGDIAGDLAVAGGNVNVFSGSSVGKDLYVAGGSVEVNGDVAGEARIAGGDILINGKISGPITVKSDRLIIGDDAILEGTLKYSSPKEAQISPNAQINGEVDYEKMTTPSVSDDQVKKFFGFAYLVRIMALILTAVVLVTVFKVNSRNLVNKSMGGFVKEAVRGFVILVVTPIAALILMISLVGFPLGILLMIFLVAVVTIACIFSGILLGVWISKMWLKKEQFDLTWKSAVLGVVILGIIGFIPVLGWLVGFVLFLSALGSVSHVMYEKIKA